jgi:hypothetical protein
LEGLVRFLLLISLFFNVQANDDVENKGVVIVLEAPLLASPSMNARVVQTARKGDKLFIHPRHFFGSPLEPNYEQHLPEDIAEVDRLTTKEFYETSDRSGQRAYIPRRYIKLITGDSRENFEPVTIAGHDPTDYRLEEPLPKGYPLIKKDSYRTMVQFGMGPDVIASYAYPSASVKEDFSSRYGMTASWLSRAEWDRSDRFYFGGIVEAHTSRARFQLFDDREATEARGQFGIGPFMTYDAWRDENYQFTLGLGGIFSFSRTIVGQETTGEGGIEERIFSTWTFAPKTQAIFQWREVFPEIDFFLGTDVQFFPTHSLTTSTPQEYTDFWNEDPALDRINVPFTIQTTFFLGFISRY